MVERTTAPTARGYWNTLYSRLRSLTVRTPDGLDLGSAPAIAVDRARMERVVSRVVRGLFAHSFGRTLDAAAELIVSVDPDAVRESRTKIEQLLAGPHLKEIQEGVFWYTYNVAADNPKVSVWLLVFFDKYACLVFAKEPR